MANEVNLGGTIYISSKRAAEITGYTQDYIGQLARGGNITAQRVSGLWYVVEESLRNYKTKADEFKPTPPTVLRQNQIESSVSFDGRDYVSAQRAAEVTGYHADYVGQLARSGKVISRQVGNRWFVDREGVIEHKRHNDALLAAVQAESVGLMKEPELPREEPRSELHFTYTHNESKELLPQIEEKPQAIREHIQADPVAEEMPNEIPIRVIRPIIESRPEVTPSRLNNPMPKEGSSRAIFLVSGVLLAVVLAVGGFFYALQPNSSVLPIVEANPVLSKGSFWENSQTFLLKFVSKNIYYSRDTN